MANPNVIEFECPRCLERVRAEKEKAGSKVDCPGCGGSLMVPTQSVAQDLFDDLFDDAPPMAAPASVIEESAIAKLVPAESPADEGYDEVDLVDDLVDDLVEELVEPTPAGSASRDEPTADPFAVDPDAPLKIDGMGDLYTRGNVYGVKCKICDTRIHVSPDQIDTEIECPECYSPIKVEPPSDNKPTQRWVKDGRGKFTKDSSGGDGNGELSLEPAIERPEIPIDEAFGLAPVTEDLLAPKPKEHEPVYELESIEDGGLEVEEVAEREQPLPSRGDAAMPPNRSRPRGKQNAAKAGPSKSTAEPSRANLAKRTSTDARSASSGKSKPTKGPRTTQTPDSKINESAKPSFPEFDFGSLIAASTEMLTSPGVLLRAAFAMSLMMVGSVATAVLTAMAKPVVGENGAAPPEPTMVEGLLQWAQQGLFGAIPYYLGLALLWLTAAYVYRDAALGKRRISSWKFRGTSELTGTFLIFAFGFFVAGLPSLFLHAGVFPMRFLVGPLLLFGAWFSQSAFAIVNVDAFQSFNQQKKQWFDCYKFMFVLAGIGMLMGLLYTLRDVVSMRDRVLVAVIGAILSVIAVAVSVVITLVFAAVCGWHCGRIVEELEKSKS